MSPGHIQGSFPLVPNGSLAPDIKMLLESFLEGRSPRTIRAYSQDLVDFQSFVGASTTQAMAETLLNHGHGQANALALRYRSHLVQRGLQSATINRRLAALRSLVRLARTFGLVAWSLEIQNLRASAYRDARGPGLAGFRRMVRQLDDRQTPKAIRDRLLLRLLYDLALRCSEVTNLDLCDVELGAGTLAVQGKGRTDKQLLTVPQQTKLALEAWLQVRGSEPGPLFTNFDRANKGCRLTSTSLYRIVRDLGRRIGIKVRPHGLRHTAITEACKLAQANEIGLEEVLDYSRHSRKSLSILMLYRDRERDVQGTLAGLVAAEAG